MSNLVITSNYLSNQIKITLNSYTSVKRPVTHLLLDANRLVSSMMLAADDKSVVIEFMAREGQAILTPAAAPGDVYDFLVDSINGVTITTQEELYTELWKCKYPEFLTYHNAALTNEYVVVKDSACVVSSVNFINPATLSVLGVQQPAYLKMYNGSTAPAISTAPQYSVGASSFTTSTIVFPRGSELYFPDGLCVGAVTLATDNASIAPITVCNVNIQYL